MDIKRSAAMLVAAIGLCTMQALAANSTNSTKYIYVVIPPDYSDWMSSVPMISTDGGYTGAAMTADPNKCGWFYYAFTNSNPSDNVFFYRDDDTAREDMIGLNGNWETASTATPIPLESLFELVSGDTLFFVPDLEQHLDMDLSRDMGWYEVFPEGVEGTCQYSLSTIIYDTDASLHPAFSCYASGGEGCQFGAEGVDQATALAAVNACIGLTPGIVEDHLDSTLPQRQKKPILSAAGEKCFISATYFNQLFNYTQGVNEKSCFDISLSRSANNKWEFDSDYFTSPGTSVQGGFYPVEQSTDSTVLVADPQQTPVAAARTKRMAEGPIFYGPYLLETDSAEGYPRINTLCNGPGWAEGYDCSGIFADGDGTIDFVNKVYPAATCVIGWSCLSSAPTGWEFYKSGSETSVGVVGQDGSAKDLSSKGTYHWSSTTGRNQQYCFESHAKFTQKPGQSFSIIGDDDIWVFIDNKLAIDLGGTHLAAPGYVNLDKFEGLSGTLVNGNTYDIDIFYCDRRTTMTNLHISTNMYLLQGRSTITTKEIKNTSIVGESTFQMCYSRAMSGYCAATDTAEDEIICPDTTNIPNLSISYSLVKGTTYSEENIVEKITTPGVYYGGIDLTSMTAPTVNKNSLVLPSDGRWTLWVTINGSRMKIFSYLQDSSDAIHAKAIAKAYSSNSFSIVNAGEHKLAIIMNNRSATAKTYAVMDMQGRVLSTGTINSEKVVSVPTAGTYVVKVGLGYKRVSVR